MGPQPLGGDQGLMAEAAQACGLGTAVSHSSAASTVFSTGWALLSLLHEDPTKMVLSMNQKEDSLWPEPVDTSASRTVS